MVKYFIFHRNFAIRDTVLVQDENISKSSWSLAHIIDVHVRNDGIARSHKIEIGNDISMRSCNKLCLIERLNKWTCRSDIEPSLARMFALYKRNYIKEHYLVLMNEIIY